MDMASAKWLSETEMEDLGFGYQHNVDPLDLSIDDELNFHPFSMNDQTVPKNFTCGSFEASQITSNASPTSSSHMITFGNSNSSPPANSHHQDLESNLIPKTDGNATNYFSYFDDQYDGQATKKNVAATSRTHLQAQDHVMAERMRRQKLSQKFIALSAVVPGLKKMDKASVVGDAINYLKQLQERVKALEEQAAANESTMESAVLVKKSQIYVDDDDSSSTDENSNGCCVDHPLPEIETRVSGKDVLVRIHCEKQKGCLVRILSEIEKLHLNVVHSSILPFGNSTLDVTVVAQMDNDFSITTKDLVRNLQQALL